MNIQYSEPMDMPVFVVFAVDPETTTNSIGLIKATDEKAALGRAREIYPEEDIYLFSLMELFIRVETQTFSSVERPRQIM